MRKLAWLTVGFTYFLMVWGNLVSATGSGMGCGDDWPRCHGTFLPALSFEVVLEWGHRILAAIATVLMIATVYRVFRLARGEHETLKKSGRTLLILLACQILLGATTVALGLSITVSTIHLIVASLVFSGLITVACVSTWSDPVVPGTTGKLQRLAAAGIAAFLIQLALGALVRHGHAGLACPQFPGCVAGFLPSPFTFETFVAFMHRWWGFLLIGVFAHMYLETKRRAPELSTAAAAAFLLVLVQVSLGVVTVLTSLSTHARAMHAAIGYGLWGILFFMAIRAGAMRWLWEKAQAKKA